MSTDSTPQVIIIPLTQGQITMIDQEDADLFFYNWYAQRVSHYANGGKYFARRNTPGGGYELIHRVILSRVLKVELTPKNQVDHINLDTLDNRRENLRLATHGQNQANRMRQERNKSGFKGVYLDRKKWRASITVKGETIHLGGFDTPEEAHEAYCKAALHHHGKFARFE